MGRLAPNTINAYRSKLKRYRALLSVCPSDHPERERLVNAIEKLTNQLGLEMSDLEIALKRGPGRPRKDPDVRTIEKMEDKEAELKAKIEEVRKRREELIARVEATLPEAEERSAKALEEMMKQHETTDEPAKA